MMRLLWLVLILLGIAACDNAESTEPPILEVTRTVLSGVSDAAGNASVTLPSGTGSVSDMPLVAVYSKEASVNRWTVLTDGDGTPDGNGSWWFEESGGSLVVRMEDLASNHRSNVMTVEYKVVVVY